MSTAEAPTPAGRDRAADVALVVNYILRSLYTWVLPADWGVDFGSRMGAWDIGARPAPRRTDARSYSSAEEVLSELDITSDSVPYPCAKCGAFVHAAETYGGEGGSRGHKQCYGRVGDSDSDWPPQPYADYARALWLEAGAVLRARGAPPEPAPKPVRPPWADMVSQDGALVLTIPDELIPFVGTGTSEEAINEISTMVGMVNAYDQGVGNPSYLSSGFVRAAFDIRMMLWRERKRVADLLSGAR